VACQEIQEDLQAYLDGELTPVRRAAIESHLGECSDCRGILAELRTVSKVLSGWSGRSVDDGFEKSLQTRLAFEPTEAKRNKTAPVRAARFAGSLPATGPVYEGGFLRWITGGWRPAAVAAAVLIAITVYFAREAGAPLPKRVATTPKTDALGALSGAGTAGEIADGIVFAELVGKRAIAAVELDSPRVALSDVVTAFLATAETETDKSVGKRLINLLAGNAHMQPAARRVTVAGLFGAGAGLFGRELHAAEAAADPLAAARQFESAGRLREAQLRYRALASGGAVRAELALGSLNLRMGDLDGAEAALAAAAAGGDIVVKTAADGLMVEIADARKARQEVAPLRATAVSAADWQRVALLEVQAYDYRSAANSFMKAAGAASEDQIEFVQSVRFRSAWCQKETGQISTGVYGFKGIAEDSRSPATLGYAAGIEQAVGLARAGDYAESIAVCKMLVKRPAGDPVMEAMAYFQKGFVELRGLEDKAAAAESLGRVSAAGQGNLSYAALILLQSSGK